MTIQKRHFQFWYIPIALMIIFSGAVAGARSLGSTSTSMFDCAILASKQNSAIIAVDASKMLRTEVKDNLTQVTQISVSPDGRHTAYAKNEAANTTIFIRANQQAVDLPDIALVRGVYWSPDGQFVAIAGLTSARGSQVLVLARANGTNAHALELTTPANPIWSSDGQYLAYTTSDSISVLRAADFTQSRIAEKPRGNLQWLPRGHTLIYAGGDSTVATLSLYDIDSKSENSYKFGLRTGAKLGYNWTPDGYFLAVYQGNGEIRSWLRLFDLADGKLRELESDASTVSFSRDFWTPDNQAIALVTEPQHALVAYSLKDNHSEVLIADGFRDVLPALDSNRYLFTRQHDNGLSLDQFNFATQQLSVIKDNIAYIWSTQADNSFFVVQQKANIYNVGLLNAETGSEQALIDDLPTLPVVREVSDSAVAIMWVTPDGGGLARYSLTDKTLSFYHVAITPRWVLVKTLIGFSPDLRQAAVAVQEPNGALLQVASLENKPPITLYQSSDGYNWVGMLNWSSDSSELLYGIANGGPAKLARSDGLELRIFSQHQDVSYSTCDDYFKN